MASTPPNAKAVVIDANVAVAIASREAGSDLPAATAIRDYSNQGYDCYAPGAILMDTLYALCQKHAIGLLSATEFDEEL